VGGATKAGTAGTKKVLEMTNQLRAVWSLWTKPLTAGLSNWASELHHLYGWILSVETATKHYPHTALYTDDTGARLLVDELGLRFEHVSTALNALDSHDPNWWAFGKMYTYRLQSEPFVHIDSDVFLWRPLPAWLADADLLVQNPESVPVGRSWYYPENVNCAIYSVRGWIPEELDTYIAVGGIHRALCSGILGGNRCDFIQYYADLGISMMEHPANKAAWARLRDRRTLTLIFEQYLLAACIEYHRHKTGSPFYNLDLRCLFESESEAFRMAPQLGYTHLHAAKRDQRSLHRLELRIRTDYPEYYERCLVRTARQTAS
jgi:hypothetical protein